MMRVLATAIVVAFGCSGPSRPPDGPTPPTASDAGVAALADTGVAEGSATPSADECDRLLDHMLALYIERQRLDRPAEAVPTAEDKAKVRASLVDSGFGAACREFHREVYDCTIAATSFAQAIECAGGDPAAP